MIFSFDISFCQFLAFQNEANKVSRQVCGLISCQSESDQSQFVNIDYYYDNGTKTLAFGKIFILVILLIKPAP